MSYTELIPFKEGKPTAGVEFRNAWGGAARIWDCLFKAYIPKKHQYDSWLSGGEDGRLWDLAKRYDLPEFERVVHLFTFDRFYVRKEHFKKLAEAFTLFVQKYPVNGCVDHLPAWVEWLNKADCEAVGLRVSSVSENLWHRPKKCPACGHSTDENEAIPISEGTEVYDYLSK